jgi:glucose/arabinose dehydrogenase
VTRTRALPASLVPLAVLAAPVLAQERAGPAAFGDWRADAPGVVRRITAADLPAPHATASAASSPDEVARPAGAALKTPPGFTVAPFARLSHPRQIRVAPNGDVFVAESDAGRIAVLRAADGAAGVAQSTVFATRLDTPFGLAFWPPGPRPQFVYVAENNAVVRFPYASGDLQARGPAQTIVASLSGTTGGHVTRDVEFSPDGARMLVSVGSGSNLGRGMPAKPLAEAKAWDAAHGVGAAWGAETDRADVLAFDPQGGHRSLFATGLRNCVTLRFGPAGSEPWCVVNERDRLGDDLPPDYATRVKPGGFYGWPWYYIGAHQDPRRAGERPDLAGRVTTPDVLFQPHSAPLGLAFYTARSGPAAFPASWRGDAFVALHGSWNRSRRTGYKIVRLKLKNGLPTGTYEDFLTGFVVSDAAVWGRPVGVAVAHDGALLFADDAGGVIWRVAWQGGAAAAR